MISVTANNITRVYEPTDSIQYVLTNLHDLDNSLPPGGMLIDNDGNGLDEGCLKRASGSVTYVPVDTPHVGSGERPSLSSVITERSAARAPWCGGLCRFWGVTDYELLSPGWQQIHDLMNIWAALTIIATLLYVAAAVLFVINASYEATIVTLAAACVATLGSGQSFAIVRAAIIAARTDDAAILRAVRENDTERGGVGGVGSR